MRTPKPKPKVGNKQRTSVAATGKPDPATLVSLVHRLTHSADARAIVAHVAVAIGMNHPATWASVAKARAVLQPKWSRRTSMAAGRKAMDHILDDWRAHTRIAENWIKGSLEALTGQSAFATLKTATLKKMFRGLGASPVRGSGGRVKGGKGNRTSSASALAALACACGAWGFRAGDEEKARKLIGRGQ